MKNTKDSQNTFKIDSAFGALQEILYQAKNAGLGESGAVFWLCENGAV